MRTTPSDGAGTGPGSGSPGAARDAPTGATSVGARSSLRRTETRSPDSSIESSPTPDSWTIRTSSRMRSARLWSTPPPTSESSPRERQQFLLARGQALGLVADRLEVGRRLICRHVSREQLDRALDGGIERRGRRPERALHKIAQLVHDEAVPRRREHVYERLRTENLADRRG